MPSVALRLLPGDFAICRLPAGSALPVWAGGGGGFRAVTRTADEASIICRSEDVPPETRHEAGWVILKFEGPFAFTETGILSSVLAPLAQAGIPILAQSTFDTDYVLVKSAQVDAAIAVLKAAGHRVSE
ncbi:MAG TPA: ACT domain-containing protein [Candidatus Didemnitutus sp.]|nr:ACT domain-containing protein [Candidatus Didemnitutus sp.]